MKHYCRRGAAAYFGDTKMLRIIPLAILGVCVALPALSGGDKGKSGIVVDKENKTITIDAKIAPRKLPHLKDIYPIEVIASLPHPAGKKAHETVVTLDVKPSEVHKALESLGLKPGAPVMGESKDPPKGPDVNLYIEVTRPEGTKRLSMDKVLLDNRTKAPFPKSVKFRFTGSVKVQPDPEKDETVYGADLSGAFAAIFPVTDQIVLQTNLTMKEEKYMKLEVNAKNLPPEGTPVKFVIEVAK
jgi:hypothetical protein